MPRSWSGHAQELTAAAFWFCSLQLGLQRFHGVGILGFNSSEWVIGAIGAILAGYVPPLGSC